MIVYADTSAVVGAYLADEPDQATLASVLFGGQEAVVTSELTRVEFASAASSAARAGRLNNAPDLLGRFDVDCGNDGPLALLRFDPARVLPRAYELVGGHRLRTLDALHLAVVLTAPAGLGEIALLTRDARQAEAAEALGIVLR